MRPFRLDVPESELEELRARLEATRWPPPATGPGWSQGPPVDELVALAEYWASGYDWRAAEAELNALPQGIATIDGADVHVVHVRSSRPDAIPLVMTHGWPGSIVEFLDVVGPLSEPAGDGPAFHLVLPTLPGYGLSGPTREAGWDIGRIAGAWAELMTSLGYARFGVQGGDWGASVARELGRAFPERVLGVHLNFLLTRPPRGFEPTPAEQAGLARLRDFGRDGNAYAKLHATRPQTLAYALTDSPAGQLAWILEKLHAWTDGDGVPLARDRVLSNVMLTWLTRTAGSSARLYFEREHGEDTRRAELPSTAPTALALFPAEIAPPLRRLAAATNRIVRWTEMPRGGHFAAWEQPGLFAGDVQAFFASLV